MKIHPAKSYQRVEAISASKIGQVVILLDHWVRLLDKAMQAIHESKIEERFINIDQAIVIITTINNNIDPASSEHAKRLTIFFSRMVAGLLQANAANNIELCGKLQVCIQGMAKIWRNADNGSMEASPDSLSASATMPAVAPYSPKEPLQLNI